MVAQLASQLAEVRAGRQPYAVINGQGLQKAEDEVEDSTRLGGSGSGSADGGMVDTEAEAASTLEL